MKLTGELKTIIIVGVISLAILFGGAYLLSKPAQEEKAVAVDSSILVKGDSRKVGPENAKVTVVEFADFECPACKAAAQITKQIKEDYKENVSFVFRHFPLSIHKNSLLSAQAVEAAGDQGKFWEMHDKMFETQEDWGGPTPLDKNEALDMFVGFAKELGLDEAKFREDVENEKFVAKIQADVNDGTSVGVRSTPTFYINGIAESGALNYVDFKQKIDAALAE
jgi:protein-disulfide isomerase